MPSLPLANGAETPKDKKKLKKEKKIKDQPLNDAVSVPEEAASNKSKKKGSNSKEIKKKRKKASSSSSSEEDEEEKSDISSEIVKKNKNKKARLEMEEEDEEEHEEVVKKAEDPNAISKFRISEPLKAKLKEKGIESLFPIQAMTFSIVLDGSDLVGRARTGQVCNFLLYKITASKTIYVCLIIMFDSILG